MKSLWVKSAEVCEKYTGEKSVGKKHMGEKSVG